MPASRFDELDRSAHLLRTRLLPVLIARIGLAAGAAIALPSREPALLLLMGAELLERLLFFQAGAGKKMPGQIS